MMHCNKRNGRRASWARGFAALWALLAIGLGVPASRAEAAPFAYVTNLFSNVSVIDTATNTVVATIPLGVTSTPIPIVLAVAPDGKHVYVLPGSKVLVIDAATNTVVGDPIPVGTDPQNLAVTPDGKHVYVANTTSANVSVIDTATNLVVATVAVGTSPFGLAVTPDGKHVYVVNGFSNNVLVIDTATNTVVGPPIPVGTNADGAAITPDGKLVYVANTFSNNVSVIATASNTVVATVAVGTDPFGVAITPDGRHAYVPNFGSNNVFVIDTASNTVVGTPISVGTRPTEIAITPDGKHAYVTNNFSNDVSVIDTATNTVGTPIPVGTNPGSVGIVPPPPGVPFLAFGAQLEIAFGGAPNTDAFVIDSHATFSSTAPGINPVTKPVKLQVGTFAVTIPPGSFTKQTDGSFIFHGVIDGVSLKARIRPTGTLRFAFHAEATGANLAGTKNPVYATVFIGGYSGATSVTAAISP